MLEYHYGGAYPAEVHAWTAPLLELRASVEAWHEARTGHAVRFNVCLLNRYGATISPAARRTSALRLTSRPRSRRAVEQGRSCLRRRGACTQPLTRGAQGPWRAGADDTMRCNSTALARWWGFRVRVTQYKGFVCTPL